MLLDIDPQNGTPIYRQIMDQVRRQILSGILEEGQQLEQVRGLASRLKVNPMTISKAYGYLENEGLLERRRGIGLFIAPGKYEQQDRMKRELLTESMKKAAILALQMQVTPEEAWNLFQEHYQAYRQSKGAKK